MYRIGIDLGGTNIAAGLVNEDFEILVKDSLPTQATRPPEQIVDDIALLCRRVCDAAGVSAVRRWVEAELECSYAQAEKLKLEIAAAGGVVDGVDYAAGVTVRALVPEEALDAFSARIFDVTAGSVTVRAVGEAFRDVPIR